MTRTGRDDDERLVPLASRPAAELLRPANEPLAVARVQLVVELLLARERLEVHVRQPLAVPARDGE